MNKNTPFESPYWDQTCLPAEQLLDEVEALDLAFVDLYRRSLGFTSMLVEGTFFAEAAGAYVRFADSLAGGGIETADQLAEVPWAGYHPIPLLFARLRWYGQLGKFHYTDADRANQSGALRGEIAIAHAFCSEVPSDWLAQSDDSKDVFSQILLAAEARLALDSGEDLSIDQVAALAGMERRSIQNALSRKDESGLKSNAAGMVAHGEALRWLGARRNFIETLTYRPNDSESDVPGDQESAEELREYTFVPVTDDGVAFLPEMRRASGYQIGKYGQEVYVEDYFEALAQLQAMDVPRFRRPNVEGNWGIKNGTGWQRVAVDDLQAAVARQAA